MASASITLPNGTQVEITGTPEEVHKLLELYSSGATKRKSSPSRTRKAPPTGKSVEEDNAADINGLVNTIKTCAESELIESRVLDSNSQLDRILLPLYAVAKHYDNDFGLTTGDISRVTAELGVRVSTSNVSKVMSKSSVSRFVLGDQVRRKGTPVKYKLSRRGIQYMDGVLGPPEADAQLA